MAEKIEFSIGSHFRGEGFDACTKAINQNRKEIDAAKTGLGTLKEAFKGISPETAKAVNGVSAFADAFVKGGIIGGTITLALKGLAEAVSFVGEKINEAKEASAAYADILKNKVIEAIGQARTEIEKLSSETKDAANEIKASLALLNGDTAREAQNKVHELHIETLQKITDDMSAEAKASLQAQEAYDAQIIKNTAAMNQHYDKINAFSEILSNAKKAREQAEANVSAATQKMAELQTQCSEYLEKRAQVENFIEAEESRFKEGTINLTQIYRDRREAELAIQRIEEEHKDEVELLKKADEDLAAARRAQIEAADAETDATDQLETEQREIVAQRKANEAAMADAEQRLKEAKKREKEAVEELAQKEKDAADKWSEFVNEQLMKLNDATAGVTEQFEDFNLEDSLEDGGGNGNGGGLGAGKATNVRVMNPKDIGNNVQLAPVKEEITKPRGLKQEVFDRIKNGTANVADFKAFDRFHQRDERDYASNMQRVRSNTVEFLKIAQKPKVWRSEADEAFMKIYKERVLPQVPTEFAAKMFQQAGNHLLAKEDMTEFLADSKKIREYVESVKEVAANTVGISEQAQSIKAAVQILGEAIKVN